MTWLSVETLVSGTSVSSESEIVLGSSFGLGAGEMAGVRRSCSHARRQTIWRLKRPAHSSSDIIRALMIRRLNSGDQMSFIVTCHRFRRQTSMSPTSYSLGQLERVR